MSKKLIAIAALGVIALSPQAFAADVERSFNFAGVTYYEPDDDVSFDNIFEAEGKVTVTDNIYVRGQATHYSDGAGVVDVNEYLLGGGAFYKLNNDLAGFADVNYVRVDVAGADFSDNAWMVRAGGVFYVNRHLELEGSIRHLDTDSGNDQQYEIAARYYAYNNISLSVGYLDGIGSDSFEGAVTATLAYHF